MQKPNQQLKTNRFVNQPTSKNPTNRTKKQKKRNSTTKIKQQNNTKPNLRSKTYVAKQTYPINNAKKKTHTTYNTKNPKELSKKRQPTNNAKANRLKTNRIIARLCKMLLPHPEETVTYRLKMVGDFDLTQTNTGSP